MNFYHLHVCEEDSIRLTLPQSALELINVVQEFEWPQDAQVTIDCQGRALDWIPGWSWTPYVAANVQTRIKTEFKNAIQWHGPFTVADRSYYLKNCVEHIDCVLPGSNANQLILDHTKLDSVHIFRPKGYPRRLIVSEEFRNISLTSGETGVRFGLIKPSGWEDFPF